MSFSYFLLMRHGEGLRRNKKPGPVNWLSNDGYEEVTDIANKLVKTLEELPEEYKFSIGKIIFMPTNEAEATAGTLGKTLQSFGYKTSVMQEEKLSPDKVPPYPTEKTWNLLREWIKTLEKEAPSDLSSPMRLSADATKPRAIVLVGNDPQIGWIARMLQRDSVPLMRSEIACFQRNTSWWERARSLGKGWRLLWMLSPEDKETKSELLNKIKSKMDAAKVLGAFITGLLMFVLKDLFDLKDKQPTDSLLQFIILASLSFTAAAWLFFSTLLAYDRLLMPQRFWGQELPKERPQKWPVWRPPSSAVWILYQNMVRIWCRMFIPATILVGIGMLFLGIAVFESFCWLTEWGNWVPWLGGLIVLIGMLFFWTHLQRPRLGVQD